MEQTTVDRKASKVLTLYAPSIFALLTAVLAAPACQCAWPKMLIVLAVSAVAGFVFWWLVFLAGFHGYHFCRSLFIILDEGTRHI